MNAGLKTTFRLLATTPNDAAVRVLVSALDSPVESIRQQALVALLSRRSVIGHRVILARLQSLDAWGQDILRKNSSRIAPSLRAAILAGEAPWCMNACQAVLWLRDYELIGALVAALEMAGHPARDMVGETLVALVSLLVEDLGDAQASQRFRDAAEFRRSTAATLERSVERFLQHGRKEIVAAFLLLADSENPVLREVLRKPKHPAYATVADDLARGGGACVGLLADFLAQPDAPAASLALASRRADAEFLEAVLQRAGSEMPVALRHNLRRLDSAAWLTPRVEVSERLNEDQQRAAVQVAMALGIPRDDTFRLIEHFLLHGKALGRVAAAEALADFHGPEANALALRALDDPDPRVQAAVAARLRRRGIPGTLARLMELVDSPHAIVRQSVRETLSEFSFARFLSAFDMLDDDVRRSTGALVKKVDPGTVPALLDEVNSSSRSRRLRALAMAQALDLVPAVEEAVVDMLEDDDHMLRAEAASTLARGTGQRSLEALREARSDRSGTVREAVDKSLEARLGGEPLVVALQGQ